MKRILLASIALLLSSPAFCAYTWHTSNVKRVYPLASGGFVITFATPSPECSRSDNYHAVSTREGSVTQEGIDAMLSVVLSAGALGKPISVYFDKDSNECFINRLFMNF
jgi:hypothetical protein